MSIKDEILNKDNHLKLREIAVIALVAFIVISAINKFVITKVHIPSGSMEPTLNIDDRVIVDKIAYKLTGINRGDIIVFTPPDGEYKYNDELVKYYIKRVIGLPGETIEGKNGYVYINNVKLDEKYVSECINEDFEAYTIPDNSYFVMGDNRNDSNDSRYWNNKFVDKSLIFGKALFRYKGGFKTF